MIFDAATVLVLRDSDDGPEVFMVRRHGKSSFMANAWVYPGGRLDEADADPAVLGRILGQPKLNLEADAPTRAAALYLAAIRETFEESGMLLARERGAEEWLDLQARPRFADYRTQLQDNALSMARLAQMEDLVFPIDELAVFAHWVTPVFEPKRFDTYFFLARAPLAQTPLHDNRETTDSFWATPDHVLRRAERGELWIAPPTERTLRRLRVASSVDDAFARAAAAGPPPCILPHLHHSADGPILLLPGDPEFPHDDPEYAIATPVTDGPTRMKLVTPK